MNGKLALLVVVSALIFAANQAGAQVQAAQPDGSPITNQKETTVNFVLDPRDNPSEEHKLYGISWEYSTSFGAIMRSGSYLCDIPSQLLLDPGDHTFAIGSIEGSNFNVQANGSEQTWQLHFGNPGIGGPLGLGGATSMVIGGACVLMGFVARDPGISAICDWAALGFAAVGAGAVGVAFPFLPSAKLVKQTQ